MQVFLNRGLGVVYPKSGASFNPEQIPAAINKEGLSAPNVRVTAAGTLQKEGNALVLKVPKLKYSFMLNGGKSFQSLMRQKSLVGKTVTISGSLVNPSPHPRRPFELSVDSFELGVKPPYPGATGI